MIKVRELTPGKWRINASEPGFKVKSVALEGLRGRPFPVREVSADAFFERVPRGQNGEPDEPAAMLRGLPTMYYYFGNTVFLYPAPLHSWNLLIEYEPRDGRNDKGEFIGLPEHAT